MAGPPAWWPGVRSVTSRRGKTSIPSAVFRYACRPSEKPLPRYFTIAIVRSRRISRLSDVSSIMPSTIVCSAAGIPPTALVVTMSTVAPTIAIHSWSEAMKRL